MSKKIKKKTNVCIYIPIDSIKERIRSSSNSNKQFKLTLMKSIKTRVILISSNCDNGYV